MQSGYLSSYFDGVAWKRLTSVEVDPTHSNQHEFQGCKKLRELLGSPVDKRQFQTRFMFLTDDEPITDTGFMTWSDVRRKNPNRSAEYHLYYNNTEVSRRMSMGDYLVIALCKDQTLLAIIAEQDTTSANQVLFLFGIKTDSQNKDSAFDVRCALNSERDRISPLIRMILEFTGIACTDTSMGDVYLDQMLKRFGESFPKTCDFSEFARSTLPEIDPLNNPDSALMDWVDREEMLFRTLERHIISKRLQRGFYTVENQISTDDFLSFSLSVHNRRKSRAGFSLEHHLEYIFKSYRIQYSRGATTENHSKPDFLFPSIEDYRNSAFSTMDLTMLGVKTTCKDRWRQVLTEADRITEKHLLTLEPGISIRQTDEMVSHKLLLVLPAKIHETYLPEQKKQLMTVYDFLRHVLFIQRKKDCRL